MPPRPRFDGSTSTRDRKRSALRKKGGPDKVDNFSVGLAVPFCMGGAEIITNMVLIEPPVLEHFDADPVGTAAERRQWVGETAWRIGGATSAAHFFLAKSGNYLKAFDSVIKAQGAREVFEGDDQDNGDYLLFESPPSAAADALARVAWEQKISTERYAEEFGKLLEHNFGASGFVPPERCAQGITETHISTRLMVEALRADMTVLTLLARKDKETNVKDKDEELEKRVLSRQAADEVAAAAAADEARERAKTIAVERAKRASAEEAPLSARGPSHKTPERKEREAPTAAHAAKREAAKEESLCKVHEQNQLKAEAERQRLEEEALRLKFLALGDAIQHGD